MIEQEERKEPMAEQKKTTHILIGKTDIEVTKALKREYSATNHGLTRNELAAKCTPEPFGP